MKYFWKQNKVRDVRKPCHNAESLVKSTIMCEAALDNVHSHDAAFEASFSMRQGMLSQENKGVLWDDGS